MKTKTVTDSGSIVRTISIDGISVIWEERNAYIEESFFPQFEYDSEKKLIEKEYSNRVFQSKSSAESVHGIVEEVVGPSGEIPEPESRVIGAPEPYPIEHTCDDIIQLSNYIRNESQKIFDAGVLAANSPEVIDKKNETSLLALSRLGIKIANDCTQLSSICSSISLVGRSANDRAINTQVHQAHLTGEGIRTGLFHMLHSLNRMTEDIPDRTKQEIETHIYSIENPVHRLFRILNQLENWKANTTETKENAHGTHIKKDRVSIEK